LAGTAGSHLKLRIINRRRFTLRQAELHLKASDIALPPIRLADIAPAGTIDVDVTLPDDVPGPAALLKGELRFVTHYGFRCKVAIAMIVKMVDAG
jgi:hypothetical protein